MENMTNTVQVLFEEGYTLTEIPELLALQKLLFIGFTLKEIAKMDNACK